MEGVLPAEFMYEDEFWIVIRVIKHQVIVYLLMILRKNLAYLDESAVYKHQLL